MIPYGCQKIEQDDIGTVLNVLKESMLTCGPMVTKFEESLAKKVSSKYAVSCNSGTAALHLCMLALGLGPADYVLVPGITFLASANAARYVGANVIFVDVDPNTGLMTSDTLEECILSHKDKNIKAVVNVHMAGQCENLEAIYKVARQHDLYIIEDAAHAVGSNYISKNGGSAPIGSNKFSDLTTFSFHPVKTIAMGEGGAVTTNSPELQNKLCLFRNHGMQREKEKLDPRNRAKPWYYEMQDLGYNFRVSDINCALAFSQLKKLEYFKKNRKKAAEVYDKSFKSLDNLKPLSKNEFCDAAWHLYVVLIDYNAIGIPRGDFMNLLRAEGIGTQVHYIPVYEQPYYQELYGTQKLPGCEQYYQQCLSLPLFVDLTPDMQERVVREILKHVK